MRAEACAAVSCGEEMQAREGCVVSQRGALGLAMKQEGSAGDHGAYKKPTKEEVTHGTCTELAAP